MSGIFGICNNPEASRYTYNGLLAQQERGDKSCGIASWDGSQVHVFGKRGTVSQVFDEKHLDSLTGNTSIGHVASFDIDNGLTSNFQPVAMDCRHGHIALCLDGRIVNAADLRKRLKQAGVGFETNLHAQIMLKHIANTPPVDPSDDLGLDRFLNVLLRALRTVVGAYAMLIIHDGRLIIVNDLAGFWPISLGKLGDSWVVVSETCALDLIEAKYVRPVEPGQIIFFEPGQNKPRIWNRHYAVHARCAQDFNQIAKPDSIIFGRTVDTVRRELGSKLAEESPVPVTDNAIVVPVPDSGNSAAAGYAEAMKLPFIVNGLIRNHYVHNTMFDDPAVRSQMIRIKYNPNRSQLIGKAVALINSSVMTAMKLKQLVQMVREGGAAAVHVRVSFPIFREYCRYGFPSPLPKLLYFQSHNIGELREAVGADSLDFLSLDGLKAVLNDGNEKKREFCTSCVDGHPALLQDFLLE